MYHVYTYEGPFGHKAMTTCSIALAIDKMMTLAFNPQIDRIVIYDDSLVAQDKEMLGYKMEYTRINQPVQDRE